MVAWPSAFIVMVFVGTAVAVSVTVTGAASMPRVSNTGTVPVAGPLQFKLSGLTSGVTLDNATGVKDGVPYVTLNEAELAPGQTATVTTTFSNPAKAAIAYAPQLFKAQY
jgi:hypothetical protein